MKNIYLIGFMCSGKSSTGRQVARSLSRKSIDLDEQIRLYFDMDIGTVFEKYGEPAFREAEHNCLNEVIENFPKGVVVSLGGGTIFYGDNLKNIRDSGIIVLLRATSQSIYNRVVKSKVRRPLLEVEDVVGEIDRLLALRKMKYEQAAHIIIDIDGKTSYEIAKIIVSYMKKRGEV